jgi:magnesium transporter
VTRSRLYRNGVLEAEGFPAEEIADRLKDQDAVVWLDVDAGDLGRVGDPLGLHELAVEDAVDAGQRPKLDSYDGHLFLSANAVRLDTETYALTTFEVSVFVTSNAVVTVHENGFDLDAVKARWDGAERLAGSGVGFLLYGLLDVVVDSQYDAVQTLDDRVATLEDLVFESHEDGPGLLAARRALTGLRRVVLPMREVVAPLTRGEHDLVDGPLAPYYQDILDHVRRASDWTDSLREQLTTIRETQLAVQGNRLNLIMKKVTGWAAIIAVPTAITGFYGQNVPYPGSGQAWGFWVSTAVMLLLGGFLYVMFKRRDWL